MPTSNINTTAPTTSPSNAAEVPESGERECPEGYEVISPEGPGKPFATVRPVPRSAESYRSMAFELVGGTIATPSTVLEDAVHLATAELARIHEHLADRTPNEAETASLINPIISRLLTALRLHFEQQHEDDAREPEPAPKPAPVPEAKGERVTIDAMAPTLTPEGVESVREALRAQPPGERSGAMNPETRAVVMRVLNLEHYDANSSAHGGVLESVLYNAILDLKALRTAVTASDDREITGQELENTFDGLLGRIEAGLEVASDIGREKRRAASGTMKQEQLAEALRKFIRVEEVSVSGSSLFGAALPDELREALLTVVDLEDALPTPQAFAMHSMNELEYQVMDALSKVEKYGDAWCTLADGLAQFRVRRALLNELEQRQDSEDAA